MTFVPLYLRLYPVFLACSAVVMLHEVLTPTAASENCLQMLVDMFNRAALACVNGITSPTYVQ
ncbi:hypothetical protein Pcac1_g5815 [Phytophthora cactorum]|nr:hypothetical protein Pcac1_g5815 [Phytophthora cactorum]